VSGYGPSDRRDPRRDSMRPDDGRPDDVTRGDPPGAPRRPPGAARERMSADYDDDRAPRRPSAGASAGRPFNVDAWTRRLIYAAAGIGAVLLAAVGGWTLMSGHRGGIPVLGPPPGPVRVKPVNPGGMEVADSSGAETDMTGHGDAHLAPGPEQPDPTALARQYGTTPPATGGDAGSARSADADGAKATPSQATAPASPSDDRTSPSAPADAPSQASSAAAHAPSVPSPAPHAAPAQATPSSHEAPATPVAGPPRQPAPAAKPAPEATRADTGTDVGGAAQGGQHMVQLAAVETEAQAHEEWARLQHRAPDLLSGRSPVVLPVDRGGRTLYRLRVSGFADLAASRAFCAKLRAEQVACTPAAF
jgi:hypothetical protein